MPDVPVAAASLTSSPTRDKVVTADDAVLLIRDNDCVAIDGFMGEAFAEELVLALERRFLQTGTPKDLSIVFCVAPGDQRGRGMDHLAHEGLLAKAYGGHWGMAPGLQKLAVGNQIEAWNLPQGVIAQLFRDTAAGKPGLLTRVGLGTFVDPRNGGGKINDKTQEDRVVLMDIEGEEILFFKALPVNVAFIRGTTADPTGNISMEREALTLEALAMATAAHNSGGLVIAQVERLSDHGQLNPHDVKVPGILVDCVVVSRPEYHTQTMATQYSPGLSGEFRVPFGSVPPMALNPRKIAARRAAMELRPNSVVNLGIGMPEGVAAVANEEHIINYVTLTAEPGAVGGMPQGGLDFGSSLNADAILDQPAQFDFYDGGGLDMAFLGMAQVSQRGDVNVSHFGPRLAGSGGFINISQNSKKLVFVGTFLAPSLCRVEDGALVIDNDVAAPKFVEHVDQITFSGGYAAAHGQPVLYVTDRCVFRLVDDGIQLIEIAPGVDLQRDILDHLTFQPIIDGDVPLMDARIFRPEPMGLADDLLNIPMDHRFAYDEQRNILFLNMEGMSMHNSEEVNDVVNQVGDRLAKIGHKVQMVVNYDNVHIDPDAYDDYLAGVRMLAGKYYLSATRYTTSSFMRLKLSAGLEHRGMSPHMYESAAEARKWVEQREQAAAAQAAGTATADSGTASSDSGGAAPGTT